jgi:hypothetical protein
MRKHLAIALYELRHRFKVIARVDHIFAGSDLDFNDRYRLHWLDEHLVVIRRDAFLYRGLLHLSVSGVVYRYMQIPHNPGAWGWGWRQVVADICVKQAMVLHGIRIGNR